jgi:hypothetical protein
METKLFVLWKENFNFFCDELEDESFFFTKVSHEETAWIINE